MTKVMVQGFGWMYIIVVLDWYTKEIVGCCDGMESKSRHWLDNGIQPTSVGFMKTCRELDIQQAFTSYNKRYED